MIFVSNYGRYRIVALHEGFDRLAGVGLGGGYTAEFRPDVMNVHMNMLRSLAAEGRLKFNGMARDASTNQDLDPAERCSSFDTATIPDAEMRKRVEDAMLANSDFGVAYWLYEESVSSAPWPAYDKLVPQGRRTIEIVAEKVAVMTQDMGLDPEGVAAYERDHANRPEVLAALEALTQQKQPAVEDLVVTA
jgi:hypothetical protein